MGNTIDTYRVEHADLVARYASGLTEEEIKKRRQQLRKCLENTEWKDSADESLDKMRVTYEGSGCIVEVDGSMYFVPGKRVTEEDFALRRDYSMMPKEFRNVMGRDFDWYIYKEDVSAAKELVTLFITKFEMFRENGMGLYIESEVKGSGKTMLSCCILNEVAKRYAVKIRFINCLDLLELTKQGYNGYATNELDDLYSASVLVVDDIGAQMSKEWIDTVFYRLVNHRYSNGLLTIYTSNLSAGDLKMDDRIIDRIEATTYQIKLPNEAVRSQVRSTEKDRIMEEIRAK